MTYRFKKKDPDKAYIANNLVLPMERKRSSTPILEC